MGVHLTFVRSVDLDEWTQRQIDAMRLGGNGNARSFFRKQGFTDLYGGKADKKYTSKAAVAYRAELAKLVEAEAAKRGEGTITNEVQSTGSLLDNLDLAEKKEQDELAKAKLAAARAASAGGVAQSKAKLASTMPGASKLVINKPPAGGGSKVVLRKPSSGSLSASNMLKKKPSNVGSKLRVNKLAMNVSSNGDADDAFEDVESTQKAVFEAEKEAKQLAADEELAKMLQEELNNGAPVALSPNGTNGSKPAAPTPAAAPKPVEKQEVKPPVSAMAENMERLKAMNSDFFSDM